MWKVPMYDTTKLTVELREIVESGVDIWDFEYPSYYKGDAKKAFEQKVIDHYAFRQIGQETVGRWLHYFRSRIREIMPYYLQLYKSQEIIDAIDDPFGNVDMTETFTQTRTGESTGSVNTTNSGTLHTGSDTITENTNTVNEDRKHRHSDTPQGAISNIDKYMTDAAVDDNEITTTDRGSVELSTDTTNSDTGEQLTENNSSETTTYTHTRKGNHGANTYAHDMIEYRQMLINIDMMIINELKDLFLQVY